MVGNLIEVGVMPMINMPSTSQEKRRMTVYEMLMFLITIIS